jgi:hypothetical protein
VGDAPRELPGDSGGNVTRDAVDRGHAALC